MAETFAADWLALREPADHRARAATLIGPLAEWWRGRGGARIVDLGCGTGSNLRWLAPRLPPAQEWTLVDHDAALLAHALELGVERVPGVGRVARVQGELAREGLEAARRADLVTASALLDLVSEQWLRALVQTCADARCAALFALTWDGSIGWSGAPDPDDARVLEAVRAHQRRDKGLGAALGPRAAAVAARRFADAGYRTELAESPWVLGPADAELALALVDGWEQAAVEQRPADAPRLHAWAERRRRGARSGAALPTVGHLDLLALPAG